MLATITLAGLGVSCGLPGHESGYASSVPNSVSIVFVDGATAQLIDVPLTATVLDGDGQPASVVRDDSGARTATLSAAGGVVSFRVDPAVPLPLDLTVSANATGFVSQSLPLSVAAGDTVVQVPLERLRTSAIGSPCQVSVELATTGARVSSDNPIIVIAASSSNSTVMVFTSNHTSYPRPITVASGTSLTLRTHEAGVLVSEVTYARPACGSTYVVNSALPPLDAWLSVSVFKRCKNTGTLEPLPNVRVTLTADIYARTLIHDENDGVAPLSLVANHSYSVGAGPWNGLTAYASIPVSEGTNSAAVYIDYCIGGGSGGSF